MDNVDKVKNLLTKNYRKYYKIVYTYLYNKDDVLDVLQEASYKAILNVDKLKKPEYADTWIIRIMINESLAVLRERKKIFIGLDSLAEESKEDEIKDMDLENAMNRLENDEREIIIMKYMGDYTFDEIAERLSLNINTVKSRTYRALAKLKDIMGDR